MGDLIFVHSSMNWIGGGIREARALIEAMIDLVGNEGTVCMPSFSWRYPEALYPPEGAVVDLRRTATKVGLLPEMFRRRPDVQRSASYWVPVCALGKQASNLLVGQHSIVDPFGPGSTCRRVMEAGGKVVGLGVALGAGVLSHLPDHDLAPLYPIDVYSDRLLLGEVIDLEKTRHRVLSLTIRDEVMRRYVPSATFVHSAKLRSELVFNKWGQANVSCYSSRTYYEEALMIGRESLASGCLPPWLTGPAWLPDGAVLP